MDRPRVAVIVAVLNAAGTLERCLRSVPAEVELLVADGGSTDGSVDVIRRHSDRMRWWCSEPDGGVYAAWNKTLGQVTGEWILFLGADDWLVDADAWSRLVDRLDSVPGGCRVAYGRVRLVSPVGALVMVDGAPWSAVGPIFGRQMSISHQGVFHRRELFDELGPFDDSFAIAGDYEFLLRELVHHEAHYLGDESIVANRTIGGLSLHGARIMDHLREIRRAQRTHGVARPSLHATGRWIRAGLRDAGNRILGVERAGRIADWVRVATGRPRIWSVE